MHQVFAGRIVDIQKREHRGAYLKQGVKQEQQSYYDNREGYYGSNGTYVTGFEYFGVSLEVKIYVFDLEKSVSFDIRDYVLAVNNVKKISARLLEHVISSNKGKKVRVTEENGNIRFDLRQLDVAI